jgi:hypothetical protein
MKVKEVIKFAHWVDGSGYSWEDTYAENVIEIKESELPKTADDLDWSWYDLPDENPEDSGEDLKITVEFYSEDDQPEHDEPLAKISKWVSDLYKEKFNAKRFISFFEMGYDDDFYDSTGCRHNDNRFIGIYGSHNDGWYLAYCDSVTGEIYEEDIFQEVDGEKTLVDIDTVVMENVYY